MDHRDWNGRAKILKLLEENLEESLHDLGVGEEFLGTSTTVQSINGKID